MKLRSSRISAIAAGVIALGTLAGITAAAPASAASWTHLCVDTSDGSQCAYDPGAALQTTVPPESQTGTHTTNWVHPSTSGAQGPIQQANTDLCMQLDHADDNNVYTDACVGDDAQQWINEYDSTTGRTVFVSYWGIVNEGLYLCLSESAGEMIAYYCGTPYTQYGLGVIDGQQWGTE